MVHIRCLQCQQMIRFDKILVLLFIVRSNAFINASLFVCLVDCFALCLFVAALSQIWLSVFFMVLLRIYLEYKISIKTDFKKIRLTTWPVAVISNAGNMYSVESLYNNQ